MTRDDYKCGEDNFDREVHGDHPKVYCCFGCGCWLYAKPSPNHPGCNTLCSKHPSANCTTFACVLPGCRSAAELKKAMRGEPREMERLPERTPEEETRLWAMLDEIDREAGRKK